MGPAKVLAVDHCARPGGAQLSLLSMTRRMPDSFLVLLLEDGPLARSMLDSGIDVLVEDINSSLLGKALRGNLLGAAPAMLRAVFRLRRFLDVSVQERDFDVVLLNSLRATIMFRLCGAMRNKPIVVMVRDGLAPPYLGRVESMLSRIFLKGRRVTSIANSTWTAEKVGRSKEAKIISPFVDQEFFDRPATASTGTGSPRVLILGRFSPWKGQDVALRAISSLTSEFSVTCAGTALFGEEEYEQECWRLADHQAHRREIDFLGHVDDVVSLIDAHDIVVHSSIIAEPFGQVVLQAMARGKVVIASNAGGPAELIEHCVSGFLHDPGDEVGLAAVLETAICNIAFLGAMRREARVSAENHRPEKLVLELQTLFETVR